MSVFISAMALASLPQDRLVLLDVRHLVGTPSRLPDYQAGHIPGAVFVELRESLAGAGSSSLGRNPLPDPERLQADLRAWGVDDDSTVVVYADAGMPSVGRAWWVLTWAGLADVRILDGGLEAWVAAGGALTTEAPAPRPGSVTVRTGALQEASIDEVPAIAERGALVDARTARDHAGDPADPRTGHIPGAASVPYRALLAEDGTVDLDRARAAFDALDVAADEPLTFTCGGGVAAALAAAVAHELGRPARLHVGSWSQWASDPDRPRAYA